MTGGRRGQSSRPGPPAASHSLFSASCGSYFHFGRCLPITRLQQPLKYFDQSFIIKLNSSLFHELYPDLLHVLALTFLHDSVVLHVPLVYLVNAQHVLLRLRLVLQLRDFALKHELENVGLMFFQALDALCEVKMVVDPERLLHLCLCKFIF